MTVDYLNKYYIVIKSTTKAKYDSALLVVKVGNKYNIVVQDNIVTVAKDDIRMYQKLVQNVNLSDKRTLVLVMAFDNKYGLVGYPVGYHFDMSSKKGITHWRTRFVLELI